MIDQNEISNGCGCFLCGNYFEKPGEPGKKFCHGTRVACNLCYDALNENDQALCVKASPDVIAKSPYY